MQDLLKIRNEVKKYLTSKVPTNVFGIVTNTKVYANFNYVVVNVTILFFNAPQKEFSIAIMDPTLPIEYYKQHALELFNEQLKKVA